MKPSSPRRKILFHLRCEHEKNGRTDIIPAVSVVGRFRNQSSLICTWKCMMFPLLNICVTLGDNHTARDRPMNCHTPAINVARLFLSQTILKYTREHMKDPLNLTSMLKMNKISSKKCPMAVINAVRLFLRKTTLNCTRERIEGLLNLQIMLKMQECPSEKWLIPVINAVKLFLRKTTSSCTRERTVECYPSKLPVQTRDKHKRRKGLPRTRLRSAEHLGAFFQVVSLTKFARDYTPENTYVLALLMTRLC